MTVGIASIGGRVLRWVFRGILLVRRPRPIHPAGIALAGTIRWHSAAAPAGVGWIDDPPDGGTQAVAARVSRSAGIPAPLPDVIGLALRCDTPNGPADLELASTGFGFPSRFWLAPQRSLSKARLTTLIPYRGARGPVLIGARTLTPRNVPPDFADAREVLAATGWTLRLYHATPTGSWHPFATVELSPEPAHIDTHLRFDAGRNLLPGSRTYAWIHQLRDPSYRLVQD